MTSTEETDEDGRPPSAIGTEGLCQQSQHGEASEDEHGTHATQIGIHAQLLNKDLGKIASTDREHGDDGIKGMTAGTGT